MATVQVEPESKAAGVGVLDDPLYEVVRGQIVELPPMGASEVVLAFRLAVLMANFGNERKLGQAVA